jgi:hypothetical protein
MSRVQKLADLHSALLDLSAATPGEPAAVEEFFDLVEAILAQREPPENAPETVGMIRIASALLQLAPLWTLEGRFDSAEAMQALIAGRLHDNDETRIGITQAFLFCNGVSVSALAARYGREIADNAYVYWDDASDKNKSKIAAALGRTGQ